MKYIFDVIKECVVRYEIEANSPEWAKIYLEEQLGKTQDQDAISSVEMMYSDTGEGKYQTLNPDLTPLSMEREYAKTLLSYVDEYKNIKKGTGYLESNKDVRHALIINCDWSPTAADALISLARDYGSWMLSHALALSLVMGKEDGKLNF